MKKIFTVEEVVDEIYLIREKQRGLRDDAKLSRCSEEERTKQGEVGKEDFQVARGRVEGASALEESWRELKATFRVLSW